MLIAHQEVSVFVRAAVAQFSNPSPLVVVQRDRQARHASSATVANETVKDVTGLVSRGRIGFRARCFKFQIAAKPIPHVGGVIDRTPSFAAERAIAKIEGK